MGNQCDKVTTQQLVIDDKVINKQPRRLPPVPYNIHHLTNHGPIVMGPQVSANILAGLIAVDCNMRIDKLQHKFSHAFQEYHEACVKVISTDTQGKKAMGSGILFLASETRVILVTAAHVVRNQILKLNLVTECNHTSFARGKIRADRVKIPVNCRRSRINTSLDAAVFLFDDKESDIVRTKIRKFPRISSMKSASAKFMCIHHGGSCIFKKICVGSIGYVPCDFHQLRPRVYIDGGPGASGAPLFNIEGDVVAILQSSRGDQTRSFLPMERILSEIACYRVNSELQLYLDMVETYEGSESKSLLRGKCEAEGIDTSRKNVKCLILALKERHPHHLRQAVYSCLGIGGSYRISNRWSLVGHVESDHFPPCNAYELADFNLAKTLLPAITIPRIIHRKLATTGSSATSQTFRNTQADYIKQYNFVEAIKMNFREFRRNGLFRRSNYNCISPDGFSMLQRKYVEGFGNALEQHQVLFPITNEEKDDLKRCISSLIRSGENMGDELEEVDRIRI